MTLAIVIVIVSIVAAPAAGLVAARATAPRRASGKHRPARRPAWSLGAWDDMTAAEVARRGRLEVDL